MICAEVVIGSLDSILFYKWSVLVDWISGFLITIFHLQIQFQFQVSSFNSGSNIKGKLQSFNKENPPLTVDKVSYHKRLNVW